MNLTVVIPFINRPELSRHVIEYAVKYAGNETAVIALSDGAADPDEHYPELDHTYFRVSQANAGVLGVFQTGMEITSSDIVAFIHNDLLIHEDGYDRKIIEAFGAHPKLGMAGFVGGRGVASNGGRYRTTSNMVGKEWGGCECHSQVGAHHGEISTGFTYAATLDGCCTIFRRVAYEDVLSNTDCFASRRPLNHWYDRNIPLHMIGRGWQVGIIGVAFDHYSANTGAATTSYHESVRRWAQKQGIDMQGEHIDHSSYLEGERQFMEEWGELCPVVAFDDGSYAWAVPFPAYNV